MEYLNTKQISEKWGISDRRVRALCKEGRIDGALEKSGTYYIPANAIKPVDKRCTTVSKDKVVLYLKWNNDVIGHIHENYSVSFAAPEYNDVVKEYTNGSTYWTSEEFENFLSERIISRERRDIEKILFSLGFSRYNLIKLAIATHAINSMDLLWIAYKEDDKFSDAITEVFKSVFIKNKDLEGDSVDSPEGYNTKRYGVYNGKYGIYKKRINPLTTDVESEVAVYELSKLFGVPCCPAYKIDEDTVFSEFLYNFSKEYIVHFRRFFLDVRGGNEYYNLLRVRPQYQADIIRMIALDFITRQDDRHLSNIAVKVSSKGESFYPLYDNGRSLFYDETEKTCEKAVKNIKMYSTAFGPQGTYYDVICDIKKSGTDFSKLLNINIKTKDVRVALKKSGIKGYRLDASLEWIMKAVDFLKE